MNQKNYSGFVCCLLITAIAFAQSNDKNNPSLHINISGPDQQALNTAANNNRDWLYASHDYSGQRYVDIKQVNTKNVKNLRPIGMYQAGDIRAFHTSPLVYNGVMYFTTRFDAIAIDARTIKLLWRQTWNPNRDFNIYAQANRGMALKDGKLIWGTSDGQLMALDAANGSIIWKQQFKDSSGKNHILNMPPLIFEDLVIMGIAGSEGGIQGWIGAFRLDNGEQVWKFRVVPKSGEPAAETWGNTDALIKPGGAVWVPTTLDPDAGLLYVGTANPVPAFDGRSRPGDNLYTNCLVVLNIRTGDLVWYKQLVAHDELDRGVTSAGPLFTTLINGDLKKMVATAGKDGVVRVMDRSTKEMIYQTPVTTMLNATASPSQEGTRVCPGILGGVQWNGLSFNPKTNMLYAPAVDWCTTFKQGSDEESQMAPHMRKSNLGGAFKLDTVINARGWLTAIDASNGNIKWQYASNSPMVAAATTTSGGLVLTGDITGDFLVFDAVSGKVLYRFNTGGAMSGGIVTYLIDNKQYIAITTGGMTPFWQRPGGSSTIIFFALPD